LMENEELFQALEKDVKIKLGLLPSEEEKENASEE